MVEPDFHVIDFNQDDGVKARKYRKRKIHVKSKTGCTTCKVKRIKCDEAKPSCKRCQRTQSPCVYTSDALAPTLERAYASSSTGLSILSLERPLYAIPETIANPSTPYGTPRITLLRHFTEVFTALHSFGASDPSTIISLGLSHPHLLDTILAVSASHLRLHSPSPSRHRVAEHFQQSLAVKSLRRALEEPLDQQGSDALLLSSMMLNLLAFSIVDLDADIRDSWVFSKDKERLSWFSLQLGYKPLLMATREYHGEGTTLSWMFSASDDPNRSYNGGPLPLNNVPAHWLALCGLDAEDRTDTNIFHEPIRILAMIKDLEPAPENYFLYLAFVGRLDFDFRDLLEESDERAMWTLGYWLGLVSRFGFWWMRPRTTLDYRAIKLWLEEKKVRHREGWEGVMWNGLMHDLESAPSSSGGQSTISHIV